MVTLRESRPHVVKANTVFSVGIGNKFKKVYYFRYFSSASQVNMVLRKCYKIAWRIDELAGAMKEAT